MSKINREAINALELAPELKADILGLFDQAATLQTQLDEMRAKVPTDSQRVVSSVDHEKFLAATKELERIKQEMADKLAQDSEGEEFLSAFSAFFS